MTADSISILARIAQSVGATEPAIRLLLSIVVGKFKIVYFNFLWIVACYIDRFNVSALLFGIHVSPKHW